MLKTIKNLLKNKLTKNMEVEIINITQRPLEGEIIPIECIKIKKYFNKPKVSKMKEKEEYFNKHGYFRSTIILDKNNVLLDGYTTYLLAKEQGYKSITILRNK